MRRTPTSGKSSAHAVRAFARDGDEKRLNAAPRECWPSAEDFPTIFYRRGPFSIGSPDPAPRLFAQIESGAGVVGLDQIGGMTHELARWSRVVAQGSGTPSFPDQMIPAALIVTDAEGGEPCGTVVPLLALEDCD
jgi:hypothetical protein